MKKTIISLLAVAALSACTTQTALINGHDGELAKKDMQTFFVGGLGQAQSMNASEVCGGLEKVAKVERTSSPLNVLLNFLTQGIYYPQDAKVYCRK